MKNSESFVASTLYDEIDSLKDVIEEQSEIIINKDAEIVALSKELDRMKDVVKDIIKLGKDIL